MMQMRSARRGPARELERYIQIPNGRVSLKTAADLYGRHGFMLNEIIKLGTTPRVSIENRWMVDYAP